MSSLVSIITPSYNSSRFIKECINSVLSQSYKDWEMWIIDDASTDNSKELILDFSKRDKRIKHMFLSKNIGAASSRNVAINKANGSYIAFLDSDDIWDNRKLEKQINFMNNNNIAFSFSDYEVISEDGDRVINLIKAPYRMTYSSYLKNTIIGCLTVILDKKIIGDFRMPNIRSSHDMALWLSIMKKGFDAYNLNENLARYRLVKGSNTGQKWRAAIDVWHVYRKVEKLSFVFSVYCFFSYVFNAIKKRI